MRLLAVFGRSRTPPIRPALFFACQLAVSGFSRTLRFGPRYFSRQLVVSGSRRSLPHAIFSSARTPVELPSERGERSPESKAQLKPDTTRVTPIVPLPARAAPPRPRALPSRRRHPA